ncbi:hypothetical protein EDC02_2196 [Micromonospora sp. Llam0]|nr:hypothetical protein EDC02_2196 [Micromonospora sp. Llam0]
MSTPAQIVAVIAATISTAEVTYRPLRRRFHTRRFAALIAAARLARPVTAMAHQSSDPRQLPSAPGNTEDGGTR